jgi:hypothetical protein
MGRETAARTSFTGIPVCHGIFPCTHVVTAVGKDPATRYKP